MEDGDRFVGIIPAGGWRIEYTADDGTKWSQPLVGWAIKEDGFVVALDTDSTGDVMELTLIGGRYRIYHPARLSSEEIQPPLSPSGNA